MLYVRIIVSKDNAFVMSPWGENKKKVKGKNILYKKAYYIQQKMCKTSHKLAAYTQFNNMYNNLKINNLKFS